MNCYEAARHLPGYLDGANEGDIQARLRDHLQSCFACRGEAQQYRAMSRALANLDPVPVPGDLALRIRIQASKMTPWRMMFHRIGTRLSLIFGNILAPLAIPATGGLLTALAVFVLILQSLLVGVPMGGVVANDRPFNTIQPAYLESFGPIPAPTFDGLTLDATVNAQGQWVNYRIISGPSDSGVTRQLDQVMMVSRFRPKLNDGEPTNGHVVLNFSAIRVRG